MLEGVNPRLIFAVIFVAGMSALMYLDRKNIERHSILFIRRTKKGITYLDRIAKKAPRFWNAYGWTGVFFAFLSIPLMLFQIGWILNELIINSNPEGGPTAILPGLSGETTIQPGASFIPIEYWLISIGILIVVHEASHGIIARLEDFEINSVGLIVLGVLPGAFVEPKGEMMLPDEQKDQDGEAMGLWDQGTYKQRLKVLSAGSFANYLTAAVFAAIWVSLVFFALPTYYSGPAHYDVIADSPAAEAGMTPGVIQTINGQEVNSFEDVNRLLGDKSPGEMVNVGTNDGDFEVELGEREGAESGFLGITQSYSPGISWFLGLLSMIATLNVLIGLFNMLPAKPLDGGQIIDTLVEEFGEEHQRKYVNQFSILMWIIVLGSLVLGLII